VTTVCPVILRISWEEVTKLQLLAKGENSTPHQLQLPRE
jgi:hypothetical protein